MTLKDFSERVAHYCDEAQVENEDYFFTVLGGVLFEIAERFPEVSYTTVTIQDDSQTTVKMSSLVQDFASFSFPPLRANGVYLPDGCAIFDTRLGEVIFPAGTRGTAEIFYNRALKRPDRDDFEQDEAIPLSDDKVELAILLAAYRLLVIDEDKKASAIKMIFDEAAYRLEARGAGVYSGFQSVDGWA